MSRKFFCAYYSYLEQVEALTEEETGRLFLAALRYARDGELTELTGNERFVFPGIRGQIDRDAQQYAEVCEKSRQNALKRYEEKDELRAHTAADKEKEKEKEKENENDMERESEKEKKSPPLPPTMAEVKDYVHKQRYDFDAEKFFSYYTARGWHLGSLPMADWQAAADTWAKGESAHRQRCGGVQKQSSEEDMLDIIESIYGSKQPVDAAKAGSDGPGL